MNATVDTSQLKVLEGFFQDLKLIDQRRVFAAGFRKAAQPLVNAIRGVTPVGKPRQYKGRMIPGGGLRRSIGTMMIPRDIGIMVGALNRKGGYHGWLMEYGTKERIRKDGSSTGSVDGRHFVENAYNRTSGQVFSVINEEWYRAIDNKIIRTNKKLK